jgi:hypothetical protein
MVYRLKPRLVRMDGHQHSVASGEPRCHDRNHAIQVHMDDALTAVSQDAREAEDVIRLPEPQPPELPGCRTADHGNLHACSFELLQPRTDGVAVRQSENEHFDIDTSLNESGQQREQMVLGPAERRAPRPLVEPEHVSDTTHAHRAAPTSSRTSIVARTVSDIANRAAVNSAPALSDDQRG